MVNRVAQLMKMCDKSDSQVEGPLHKIFVGPQFWFRTVMVNGAYISQAIKLVEIRTARFPQLPILSPAFRPWTRSRVPLS